MLPSSGPAMEKGRARLPRSHPAKGRILPRRWGAMSSRYGDTPAGRALRSATAGVMGIFGWGCGSNRGRRTAGCRVGPTGNEQRTAL